MASSHSRRAVQPRGTPSTRLCLPCCCRICRTGRCLRCIHAGLSCRTRVGASPPTAQGSLCQSSDAHGYLGTFWLEGKEPSCFCVSPPLLAKCPADSEEAAGQERPRNPIHDPSLPTSGSPEENTLFCTTGGGISFHPHWWELTVEQGTVFSVGHSLPLAPSHMHIMAPGEPEK